MLFCFEIINLGLDGARSNKHTPSSSSIFAIEDHSTCLGQLIEVGGDMRPTDAGSWSLWSLFSGRG